MKSSQLRKQNRSEAGIDLENYNRLIEAVQGLLDTNYDPQFFNVQGGNISGKWQMKPIVDDFHLTWHGPNEVVVGEGLVWTPFQHHDDDDVTMHFSSITTIVLGSAQYSVIYAEVHPQVSDAGHKDIESIEIFTKESATAWIMKNDVSANGSGHEHYYQPLYCFSAQTGSGTTWTDYALIHDCRYAIHFTFDVQGYTDADGINVPFP